MLHAYTSSGIFNQYELISDNKICKSSPKSEKSEVINKMFSQFQLEPTVSELLDESVVP